MPGVVLRAVIRVYLIPGPKVFRLVAAAVLLPIGLWLIQRALVKAKRHTAIAPRRITVLAFVVGVVGGVYGIGGGSILGPILVGTGMAVTRVAPAALASTFVTSVVGVLTYALLALTTSGSIAPDWPLRIACGVGGLVGGYVGARLQPRVPERTLQLLLGTLAIAGAVLCAAQALTW